MQPVASRTDKHIIILLLPSYKRGGADNNYNNYNETTTLLYGTKLHPVHTKRARSKLGSIKLILEA